MEENIEKTELNEQPEKADEKKKKKKKGPMKPAKKVAFILIALLLYAALAFSAYKVINRARQIKIGEAVLQQAQQAVTVVETPEAVAVTEEAEEESDAEEEAVPLEKPPIYVDFDFLHEMNEDIVGWLYCEDTQINFDILQYTDNDYYLSHLSDGSYGIYGSVFLDYRCAGDMSDLNTIIYGHDMQNGSMFGELELYRSQEYYENHKVMYLLTPEHNYRLDAVCGYIHTYDVPLYDLPAQEDGVENSVWTGIARSTFDSGITPSKDDRFITLSTCADDYSGARYALILRMTEIG